MDFSFGIVTGGGCDDRIGKIISSIVALSIPRYEIIIVGSTGISGDNIKIISFDESLKAAWITRKKNLITQAAKFENIVFLHDYVVFDHDWYQGFLKFGNNFEAVMCRIKNLDESRYRDWCLWNRNNSIMDWVIYPNRTLIPYDLSNIKELLYFSGTFWVAKKNFMEMYPLNEDLVAGQAEDVEWSKRVQKVTRFQLNSYSEVKLLKNNLVVFQEPGKFREAMIRLLITTRFSKIDFIYRKIPSYLENNLYSVLKLTSRILVRMKS